MRVLALVMIATGLSSIYRATRFPPLRKYDTRCAWYVALGVVAILLGSIGLAFPSWIPR